MVEISISVEGVFGLTWPLWKRMVRTVEDLGFGGLYMSDHFVLPKPPDYPSLELITALTYAADHTERVRFGPMVSPLSVRDPVMLARQAAALDDLSGGRMVLGIGAGWMKREHEMFGFECRELAARFAYFEEGLAVITGLLRSPEPVTYEGRYFQLREAVLPGPRRPAGPPVMVGVTGPRRGLPLVARYADGWNVQLLSPKDVRERSSVLDNLLKEQGRSPEEVVRSFNAPIVCGRTPAELEDRLRGVRRYSDFREMPLEELLDAMRAWPGIVGSPEEVVAQIEAYAAVGITEMTLQWFGVDDIEGLEVLAADVLPRLKGRSAA